MFTFAVALLSFQACLVQTVFGQIGSCEDAYAMSPYDYAPTLWSGSCGEPFGSYGFLGRFGYGSFGLAGPFAGSFAGDIALGPDSPYGGAGVGEVAVAGELPAGGATIVAGQVPILGAVEFSGPVHAVGTITISGTCSCGCAGPYL